MNFSYPIFLYLIPLSIIPIIIHLIFNIIKHKKPFPNVFILRAIKEQERGLRKISDLILIALRTLVILLVILSISKPYISSTKMPNLIIFDVSASLNPFKETIEKISNEYPNIKKVYISDRIYDNIPREMLSTFNYELLNKLDLKNAILISDFQRTNFKSIGSYKKYKIGGISKNRAILSAKQEGDSLIVKIRGNGTLEIYEDEKLIYLMSANDSIIKISNLSVKSGFLMLKLLPLDSLSFDNHYYTFYEPSKVLRSRIFADNIDYKIISSFLNSVFRTIEGDEVIFVSQKNFPVKSILSERSKVILFFNSFDVPFEIKLNYIFNGAVLDSVMLFSGNVIYKKDNVILIGIKASDLLLNPKLAIWFEKFLNNLIGNYRVYYANVGERINFDNEINIRTPTNLRIRTNSIALSEVGFYLSDDEKIVICSNVNRDESLNEYLNVRSDELPKISDLTSILLALILIIVLIEAWYIGRR